MFILKLVLFLSSDLIIEKDFNYILKNKNIDLFVNRIESYNPLNKKFNQDVKKYYENNK